MATGRVRPTWNPPGSGDSGAFTFGVDVVADQNQGVSGIWWYQPAGVFTDIELELFVQATETAVPGSAVTIDSGDLVADDWNFGVFASPVTMTSGVTYTIVGRCGGEHGFEDPAGYTIDDPSNTVHLPGPGRFVAGNLPYPIVGTWTGEHGLDIEMVESETNGTLSIVIPVVQLSLDADAIASATLALQIPLTQVNLDADAIAAATLNLQIPVIQASLDADAIASGTLAIQIPVPEVSLDADAIASATLAMSIPVPELELEGSGPVSNGVLNITLPPPAVTMAAQAIPRGDTVADGPCDWTIDTSCVEGWDDLSAHAQLTGYNLATYQLWAQTGRHFGLCQITVQPCRQRKRLPLYLTYPVPGYGLYGSSYSGGGGPTIEDGQWYNRCGSGCRCRARCETPLDGPTSTANVLQVTVRGEVVAPAAYEIQNGYLLVRTDGECWPTCVDYSKQDPPEFTVTYLRGDPLPAALQSVAGLLAYEYGLACAQDDRCRLPARLQSLSRQGVSVQVSPGNSYLDFGMTGIAEVDQLVIALNPGRLFERPQVLSPDRQRPRMVT